MREFEEKKRNRETWFSDPIYTHKQGYKLCLRVDANGYDGASILVYLYLMKGENDDRLTWPFKETIEVSLMNQYDSSGSNHSEVLWSHDYDTPERLSAQRVLDRDVNCFGRGASKFITHHQLERKKKYLKDNCLCFLVKMFHAQVPVG